MASSTITNAKYLDYTGLSTLVSNIKTLVDNKIIDAKQVLGGRLSGGLATSAVQISLQTPSGFTVAGTESIDLSTIEIPAATITEAGVMSSEDKKKLDSIAAGGEVNQNAFSNVQITNNNGGTKAVTIAADSKTDTLNLTAGTNIKITGTVNSGTITIDNTYVHPEYSTVATSSKSTLTSGSTFTTLTGIEYHDDGHNKTIISKEFTLPKLIDNISFTASSTTTSTARSVNVVQSFTDITKIAGTHQVNINYELVEVPTKAYVDFTIDDKIATADALIYKGIKTATTGNKIILETDAKQGYLYKVAATGNVCIKGTTANGAHVEVGDMIIANKDNPSTLADWDIIERNIDGAVSGPTSVKNEGNIAVFNGTTGKIIKDGGVKITDLATSGHVHDITLSASGDSEITVKKEDTGTLAVSFTVSHNAKLGSTFDGTATTSTAAAWGDSVTVKVPKLNVNTYGHVTDASEVDYTISIPSKPTHPWLDLTTEWGYSDTEGDLIDTYDPDENDDRTWKIYKGVKHIVQGSNITVTPSGGVYKIANTYKYTLPTAKTNALGGIKIYKDNSSYTVSAGKSSISGNITSGKYYGVEIDKADAAFVYVPWENDKVQSTTVSGGTHYLLGSDNSDNEIDFVYKRNNVYITDDEVLSCSPSTEQSTTSSKVITHSDAITVAMINALFA